MDEWLPDVSKKQSPTKKQFHPPISEFMETFDLMGPRLGKCPRNTLSWSLPKKCSFVARYPDGGRRGGLLEVIRPFLAFTPLLSSSSDSSFRGEIQQHSLERGISNGTRVIDVYTIWVSNSMMYVQLIYKLHEKIVLFDSETDFLK